MRVGYLLEQHAIAFANMGRVTALHGVVATRHFSSPVRLSHDDVVSMLVLCQRWFVRMHAAYGPVHAQHPTLTFDLLPNGGASQTHPHMQPHLTSAARYPGKWESMRQAACAYSQAHPSESYYSDVARVHERIGLVLHRSQHTIAFISLTSAGSGPQIDILADGDVPSADQRAEALMRELGGAFHTVLSGAQSALGWDAISASCALPPMDVAHAARAGMPRVCRIVRRGTYGAAVSDLSANELFETPVVSVDLFEAARKVRAAILRAGAGE